MMNRTILVAVLALAAGPAAAEDTAGARSDCGPSPAPRQIFTSIFHDFRQLPSRESLGIAALGGIAAVGARTIDSDVTRHLPGSSGINSGFKAGAVLGGTPFALGAATATYAFGRVFDKPCGAALGADLIRAQVMAEALSTGVKEATRRSRPEGSGFSFPSGHTTVAFASATVLQRHFGWKVGAPAYGVAAYVAASRVEM
jgi:membrane-associated phospholipid phosphatase